jgi:hypothetical protein
VTLRGDGNLNRYEALSKALTINAGMSLRAEDLQDYDNFFVDPINTDTLTGNANQIVYGRRGSGKTLLLGTLNNRVQATFPRVKVASFYYTAVEFRSSAEYGGLVPTVREKTHAFFHSFIEKLCSDIVNLADTVLFRKLSWLQSLTLAGDEQAAERDRLVAAVVHLMDAAAYGVESPSPVSIETKRQRAESSQKTRSKSAAVGMGGNIGTGNSLSGNFSVGAQRGAKSAEDISSRVEETLSRRFDPSRIRQLIGDIVDLLDLEYIVIFIDEWMSLAECQVEFAERLRQCLFGDHRIAVKIAADQFQGEFSNSGEGHNFRGLEIGGDIFIAVDLDRPFRDLQKGQSLFAEALYRRLLYFEPGLEEHFGRPPLTNREMFVEGIFKSKRAFEELCLASNGLCRDFHHLVQLCAKQVDWTISPSSRIDLETVRRAILEKTEQTYARAVKSLDSNILLFRVINPHIVKTKSRYFILESRPGSHTPVMNDLLSKRIIHSVPNGLIHPSIRGAYDCFEIDYGIFIDLVRAAEYSTGERFDDSYKPTELVNITSDNKDSFLLDLSPLRQSQQGSRLLRCPHCDAEFASNDKAYVVRRICPECFQDQPETGS